MKAFLDATKNFHQAALSLPIIFCLFLLRNNDSKLRYVINSETTFTKYIYYAAANNLLQQKIRNRKHSEK